MAISLASLRRGGDARPPRLLTYGVAGVGKTLFATSAPRPVVVQTEDGLGTISASTFGVLRSFDAVMEALGSLYTEAHDFETLVVDSLDWLEPLVWQHTAQTHNQPDIESFGYGKGYLAALDTWRSFLDGVNALRDERGMGVILIAHAEIKRFDSPETEPYDRYQPKLHRSASALVQEHVDAVLFANYRVSTLKSDVGFNKKVGRLDLYGLQALVMRAVVESGECFVRLLPADITPANPIGLRLQVLESDHLDTARQGVIEGVPTLQGIGLGEAGEPVGYWLHRVHPGASWVLPGGATWLGSQRVPARDVLHIYRKRRPGQLRDVSWLAPVLTRLRDLGDYEAALLMKAKIEACLAAVVSEDGDDAMTGPASGLLRDAQGRTVESFEPGMILYRRGMGSVEVVNPSGGGSHAAFARRALEASAVGTGLTYDQVAGDLTQANYSSLRAGKIEFRRLCEQVQYGMLIPMLVRPIADRFHAQGALRGLWGAEVPDGLSHVPPAHEMIDPLKDTTALIAQVRAGFVPQPEAVGAFGYDFRQVVEMIREANALLDEAGLSLDSDPRRVAKSGAAQDAAQLAAIEIAATGAASPRAEPAGAPS